MTMLFSHSFRPLNTVVVRCLTSGFKSHCYFNPTLYFPKLQNVKNNFFLSPLHAISFRPYCSQIGSSTQESTVSEPEMVNITFITSSGEKINVKGKVGQNVMELGMEHDVGMAGACEGQLACTTCHVYVDEKYQEIAGAAEYEEEDLLDMAPFVKPNSRLSCQIILTKDLEGACFHLPAATVNFYVDGQKPAKH